MLEKIKDLFTIEDDYEDGYEDEEMMQEEATGTTGRAAQYEENGRSKPSQRRGAQALSKPNIMITKPKTIEDAKDIIDYLMEGTTVAIDLEKASERDRQRIMDMVSGYCYCSSCEIEQVNMNIFLVSSSDIKRVD